MMSGADFSAELHTFMLDQKSGAYAISYDDIPADISLKPIEEVLDVNRNGMVNGAKGKLLNETSILLNGYSGREVTIQAPNVPDMIGRLYFVDRRIYTLVAVTSNLEDGKRFLDSFKLLDKQEEK